MTVGELIEKLQAFDPAATAVLNAECQVYDITSIEQGLAGKYRHMLDRNRPADERLVVIL